MAIVRVMISRVLRGDSPFKPDREHLHHILLKYGFKHSVALSVVLVIAISFSALGIYADFENYNQLGVLILFVICFSVFVLFINKLAKLASLKQN